MISEKQELEFIFTLTVIHPYTAEQLILTSNCDETNTIQEIEEALIVGIKEEINAMKKAPMLIHSYMEQSNAES